MTKKLPLILFFAIIFLYAQTQEYRIAFYNVENLFDLQDNPNTNDDDFLPTGSHHWDSYKYHKKIKNIYKTLMAVKEFSTLPIIGLAEIESEQALNHLIYKTPLFKNNFSFIHHESPDERGIDAALLYDKDLFNIIETEFINVSFPFDTTDKTRDIIYVKGHLKNCDTLNIFVNHWPSRYGGYMVTEPKRCYVASLLKQKTDSLLNNTASAKIIIMGDFNDEPESESIKILTSSRSNNLINLMGKDYMKGSIGTMKYRNNWFRFDQLLISKNLLPSQKANSIFVKGAKATICNFDFLMEEDKKYLGQKPFRTYRGPAFHGGFSDHLPIYLDISCKKN
ncbi:MAG: endonuclease [Bacteroidota bacterium]|nr:endonuclease [Bacteroidota bacterium]